MGQRRTEAWSKWRGLVAEQAQSGQSVLVFCRERGLRSGQFFGWKKKLRELGTTSTKASLAGLKAETAEFVAVEVAPAIEPIRPAVCNRALEVRVGGDRSIMVEPGFDADHLRAVLSALESRA